MRIAAVEVIPYALPFKAPYVTARGTLVRREMVLLRLRDTEGAVGLGEAVPLSLRGGTALAEVVAELEGLRDLPELTEATIHAAPLSAPARCAAQTALLDLRARHGLVSLLYPDTGTKRDIAGAGVVEEVTCNATLVAGAPAAVADQAVRWAEDGFSTFKLKVGPDEDLEPVRAVREAVGPEARIRLDANASWDLETARRALAALEPLGIELVEQPVATLEEMATLAGETAIPLAADESVASRAEAERAAALGACAYTGVKLSKIGGPAEAIEIADVLPAYLSSALDGPVGIAAAAQVAVTLRETDRPERLDLAHGLATQRLFASTVAAVGCELRGDILHLPPGPGLGVEIDEDALDAHRI